jgi:serine/threonine-protein kinase OSR1/STK39
MQKGICRNGVLDEVAIATVLREVIKGLEYFHTNGHMHRYIKISKTFFILKFVF